MAPILLTRPKPQSESFAKLLETSLPGRFTPIISPLMEIVDEPGDPRIEGVQSLLFTSANGVAAFARKSDRRDIPALCVGNATTQLAVALGFSATSARGDVSALATLAAQSYLPDGGHFLHIRGSEAAGDLVGALMSEGIAADEQILYHRHPLPLNDAAHETLAGSTRVILPLFSPRTAAILAGELTEVPPRAPLSVVALSSAVASAFDPSPTRDIRVATAPDAESLLFRLAETAE